MLSFMKTWWTSGTKKKREVEGRSSEIWMLFILRQVPETSINHR
jgi:hypothetical protein